jgi:prepilin-type N-terminal cleavage/methylation domain-containing protein
MTNVMKNEKGMTLLEVIVVLAVLGALTAMLAPVVFRYIDDANRARAQADTRTIATAIQRMYGDTGRWPFYADGNGGTAYVSSTDANFLSSTPAPTCDMGTLADCDGDLQFGSTAGWTSTAKADTIVRHLVTNADPAGSGDPYNSTSTFPRAWKGPYTDAIPSVDAWGNPYLVNINGAPNNYATFAISAGPNGIIETAGNSPVTTNLAAGGDDIISRVK